MVGFILVVGIIILISVILINIFKYISFKRYLLRGFKEGNVITFGRKRKGKDIVHQYVINHRHKYYYGNISYGGNGKVITLKDISLMPNTYDELINDNVTKI